jgi:hypothetical protein
VRVARQNGEAQNGFQLVDRSALGLGILLALGGVMVVMNYLSQ